jgi:hypothetical protein
VAFITNLVFAHNLEEKVFLENQMQYLKVKECFKILIGAAAIILIGSSIGVLSNLSLVRELIGSECSPFRNCMGSNLYP